MVSNPLHLQGIEVYDRIHLDNKLTSEFVKSVWSKKEMSWEMFLGDSLTRTVHSLKAKYDIDAFLSGKQRYFNLKDLNSSERKLLIASYSLNLLKESNGEFKSPIFDELAEFQDDWDSMREVNPYYQYLESVSTVGLGFNDYTRFFSYESLIELDTIFWVAYGLFGSGVAPLGSIGLIADNLREIVKCFLAHGLDEKDKILFSKFENLEKETSLLD
ncbi:hypothetical protein H8356DRAFT_1634539 [Neocallimastix lanati (nom. inval.)]|nr:hypothetical protein H8356DRAFT_1634539 [Neocallimastix sp. JGI-2020a]